MSLLQVRELHAYYGKSHILQGVDLSVASSEIVALLGRNGVGRSTTLKALMGIVPPVSGSVRLEGRELTGLESHKIACAGLGYVPENRDIFPSLTVRQNLVMGLKSMNARGRWDLEELLDFFPLLREREDSKGANLSGGEQQMLTICRSLLGDPKVILIDEPTEGLAPLIVRKLVELFLEIKRRGVSVLVVEQKLAIALEVSERIYVMGHGRIVWEGTPLQLKENPQVRSEWLEV